jgi:hypothetical protein
VPEQGIGTTHIFSYIKEMEMVGTYRYSVEEKSDELYTLVSITDVSYENEQILLECNFTFDDKFSPEEYYLIVEQNGEKNEINVTFTSGNVISTVFFGNESVTLSEEFPDGAFLTENNMPGIWEMFLIAAELEIGERYAADVYIPQGGTVFDLELYVNNNPQTITVDNERLSCTVIQETTLDLRFYMYEGKLVQMRNDDQDLIFTRISG